MVWDVCYGPYKLAKWRERAEARSEINRRSAEDILDARRELAARSKATVVAFGVAKSAGCLLGCAIFMLVGFTFTYHGLVGKVFGAALIVIFGFRAIFALFGEFVREDINDWHRARRELRPKWINDIESVYAGYR